MKLKLDFTLADTVWSRPLYAAEMQKRSFFFHFYGLAYCAQYETRFKNVFFETRCGKRVFRKRSSNQRNLKTPALRRFSVEGKHFANG